MITSVAASWQNLPADILLLIAERSEIRRLRAVCSSWRSSLPLPYKSHHPLRSAKIPLPSLYQDRLRDDLSLPSYLTLMERNIYCLEPLGNDDADFPESCWIVKLEETSSGKMRFYSTLWAYGVPAVLGFLDCRVILVGKEYTLKLSGSSNQILCYKVILSDDAMLCRFSSQKLGYFKFGDERWTMIVHESYDGFSYLVPDITHHKQKFYVVDFRGQIRKIDSSLKVEEFVSPAHVRVDGEFNDWFFVQSDGDLFVVNKNIVWTYPEPQIVRFKVYRLNSDGQQWNEVTNLGDQSFFIGDDCAFSIGSGQFYGCGKNFIFSFERKHVRRGLGFNISVFSLEDNSFRPLHVLSFEPSFPRLFWPIPWWLKRG